MKQIINLDAVVVKPRPDSFAAKGTAADKFDAMRGEIGRNIGAVKLGCNLTVVPAGKCAFPFHNHHVNEEMFLVLEGSGELRTGTEACEIKAHDVIACPAGGPDSAHQIINTGTTDLRYLEISTLESPEYVEYPDSGKFGVYGKRADAENGDIHYVGRTGDALDYWDGE
jgi:uncharacterized cupin superfamily protein